MHMDKNVAMKLLNNKLYPEMLSAQNTHWSNIVNYGSKTGWWLNIPFYKFDNDLFFILNNSLQKYFYCVKLPAKTIASPQTKFRDKNNTADIFMPCAGNYRMIDVQSKSSMFDFNPYQIIKIDY